MATTRKNYVCAGDLAVDTIRNRLFWLFKLKFPKEKIIVELLPRRAASHIRPL